MNQNVELELSKCNSELQERELNIIINFCH